MHREEKQARSGSEYLQQLQWRQEVCWSLKDRLSGFIGLGLLLPNTRRWYWFPWFLSWAAHLTYRSTWLSQSVQKVYNKFLGKSSSICWFSFTKPCEKSMLNYAKQAKGLNSLVDWCGLKRSSKWLHLISIALWINFYWALFWGKFDSLTCTFNFNLRLIWQICS